MGYAKEMLPRMIRYRLAHWGLVTPGVPINLTFSVTNVCQSRCKTCNIWELYKKHPERRKAELKLEEIQRIFSSLGHVYVFNVSGGEPFLRDDFVEIVAMACRHLTPGVIHIPTNALAVDLVEQKTIKILKYLKKHGPGVTLTVKPSLDHIGDRHDQIRGIPGNFDKVMRLFKRLKTLQQDYDKFHVELGTVISRWNVDDVAEIAAYISRMGADSYRNEIAEQRSEMFNTQNDITPSVEKYEAAIQEFISEIRNNMRNRVLFQRITHAFRIIYYDLAIQILKTRQQALPCYAGISNAHMTPYGDVWACCTLGYDKSMGNLRDFDYDFKALWNSDTAKALRADIKAGKCHCPLANQTYSNMLMHGPSLLRVLREIIRAH